MANITNEQMQVLIKIIAAVETGGQVYGQGRYDDYTPAYTNSDAEVSCTIGAFQEYNWYAKALLQEILDTYPSTFRKYDNAGIESDLKKSSWDGYSPARNSAKAKAIQAIVSSPNGIKIQNERIERLLISYIAFAEGQGVSNVDALFMSANFIHQGGNSALTRILKKTPKPYTLDNLYNACKSDTGNQVGAYKSRQNFVYNALKTKLSGGDVNMVNPQQIIDDAVDYAVRIANDNEHGYSQAVRSLYNITNPKSYDCSSLVLTAFYYAFVKNGLTEQAEYLKRNCSYTGNMLEMLNCGFEVVARNQTAHSQMKKGDIELNTVYHTALAIDGDNIVHARTSEGTSDTRDNSGNEIRTQPWYNYSHGWTHRLRFTGKGISLVSNGTTIPSSTPTVLKLGSSGSEVKTLQENLIKLGYSCGSYGADGDFGSATESAVKKYQSEHGLVVDGQAGVNTLTSINNQLSGSTNTSVESQFTFTMKTIKEGSVGNHVLLVQEILKARGFTGKNNKELILDKEAGADTIEAIRKYQVSRNGACGRTDGIADEKTLKDMIAL